MQIHIFIHQRENYEQGWHGIIHLDFIHPELTSKVHSIPSTIIWKKLKMQGKLLLSHPSNSNNSDQFRPNKCVDTSKMAEFRTVQFFATPF